MAAHPRALYKIVNNWMSDGANILKEGLNIYEGVFDYDNTDEHGGLYFTDVEHVIHWLRPQFGIDAFVFKVDIPKGAVVVPHLWSAATRWKAKAIILSAKMSIIDFIELHNLEADILEKCDHGVLFLKHPPEDMVFALLEMNGQALYGIRNPTHEMMLTAVKQNGMALQYIKRPTPEICAAAIAQNPAAASFLDTLPRGGKHILTQTKAKMMETDALAQWQFERYFLEIMDKEPTFCGEWPF